MVLERRRKQLDSLIQSVKQTVGSMREECVMSDKEKFMAFKEEILYENEEKYGEEIRERYGDDEIESFNRKMLNMQEEEWLCMTLKQYSPEIHKSIASMYVLDTRFKNYYDSEVSGCAALLGEVVSYWANKL